MALVGMSIVEQRYQAVLAVLAGDSVTLLDFTGQLAVSALLGVVIARHALDLPVLASVSARTLANPVGQTLQYYLVEPW